MSNTEYEKSVIAGNKLVVETCERAQKLILDAIKDEHPKKKWLLYSRITAFLFSAHFQLSINAAKDSIERAEKQMEPQP